MTLVKAVISEKANQNNKHEYYPISTTIKDEGQKKPDTLVSTFNISNIVKEGDFISYIQDMVDVDFLRAIYNFHLSALDDRGYNLSPDTDALPSQFEVVDHGKFLGNYALKFTNPGDFVAISNLNLQGRIDLQKQFDITVWFTPDKTQLNDGGDEPLMWSYFDFPSGLEIGISGTNGNDSSWRGFTRIGNGSIIQTITGSSQTIMNTTSGDDDPVFIRVFRGGDNIIKMEVNGRPDGELTVSQSLNPSNQEMIFGDGNPTEVSKEYVGLIHQIRIYCGNTLTSHQADIVRWAKPQSFTQKFSGKIWKVKDNEASKTAYALANSQGLLALKLLSQNSYDLETDSFEDILSSVIDEINNDPSVQNFTLKIAPDVNFSLIPVGGSSTLTGDMYEIGSFLDFLNILLVWSQTSFYTTPQNLLIIEPNTGRDSNIIFDQDSQTTPYDVTVSESNDNQNINSIFLKGRASVTTATVTTGTGNGAELKVSAINGEIVQIYILDGGSGYINPDTIVITDSGDGNGALATLTVASGEIVSIKINTPGQNYSTQSTFEISPSVNDIRRTLRRNVLQLVTSSALEQLGFSQLEALWGDQSFPNANSSPKIRFAIKITSLLNSVRYNQKVNLINSKKNLDEDVIISQVSTGYPSGNMVINCNNFDIDSYENIVSIVSSRDELQDDTFSEG